MEQLYKYRSEIQEIPHIRKDLSELALVWVIPESELRQISVIIEELFSNIVRFAFEDNQVHMIGIKLTYAERKIQIEIIDDGIPFNPLEYQHGPILDPATSDAGGMGLTLVQTFSDSITYKRTKMGNHLIIMKRIKSQP